MDVQQARQIGPESGDSSRSAQAAHGGARTTESSASQEYRAAAVQRWRGVIAGHSGPAEAGPHERLQGPTEVGPHSYTVGDGASFMVKRSALPHRRSRS
jgi:hypothetical protein